jgi:hypothetical protein
VRCEAFAAEGDDFLRRARSLAYDDGFVGVFSGGGLQSFHSGVTYKRMGPEDGLYFRWVELASTDVEQVLPAAGNVEAAGVVQMAVVIGIDPGRGWVDGVADGDDAVDDGNRHARQRMADGGVCSFGIAVDIGGNHAGFGGAIGLPDGEAETVPGAGPEI